MTTTIAWDPCTRMSTRTGTTPAVCIGDPPTASGLPRVSFRGNESRDLPRVGTRRRPQARGRGAANARPWPAGDRRQGDGRELRGLHHGGWPLPDAPAVPLQSRPRDRRRGDAQWGGRDPLQDRRPRDGDSRLRRVRGAGAGGRSRDVRHPRGDARRRGWGGRMLLIGFVGGVPHIPANRLLVKHRAALGSSLRYFRWHAPDKLRRSVEELLEWYAKGTLKPLVTHRLPLERGAEAIRLLTDRKAHGKVVVMPELRA